jgi:diguanylate cyclase (GGDEF)-like protein
MSHSARFRRSLLRFLSSWLLLALALVTLAGLGGFTVALLQSRGHQQAVTAATEDARVISRLSAVRDLGPENATEPLTSRERDDLDGDVAQLSSDGALLELSIRRADGTALYRRGSIRADRTAISTSGVPSAQVPRVRFYDATGPSIPRTAAITVELPADVNPTAPPLIISVTIPADTVENQSRYASNTLTIATLSALVVAAVGLVMMRRRFRRRGYQASHDSLTGLGNRMLLERTTITLFERGVPFALLMMDLDGFKRINDSLGHAAGDEMLILVGQALQASIRPEDLLVRLGGDEFAALMPGLQGSDVEAAANRLLLGVRRQFTTRGVAVDCDASVGAAVAGQDGQDFGELLQAADIAMYQAKRGKLGVRVFADSDEEIGAGDLQTLIDLRLAIEGGQLRLYYQPAVAMHPTTDGEHYLEALVRWEHPTRGFLAPDQFIPLAEDTALIHPLTEWVLNEAARQCAEWRLDAIATTIAVNVSPRSLTHPGLVPIVIDTLARHQLPAAAIHLEITESAIISNPDLAREILTELSGLGINISIDDFGTGYTSLAHLKTMPVETLKIDRVFVSQMLADHSDDTLVTSIINLAHGLGMRVVAEGVEDEATLRRLADLGCDIAQGFHLSRPLTPTDAARWMRQQPSFAERT